MSTEVKVYFLEGITKGLKILLSLYRPSSNENTKEVLAPIDLHLSTLIKVYRTKKGVFFLSFLSADHT